MRITGESSDDLGARKSLSDRNERGGRAPAHIRLPGWTHVGSSDSEVGVAERPGQLVRLWMAYLDLSDVNWAIGL